MKAHLRKIRISPKKANLVAGMVRGKKVLESLDLLKFMPKKGADILYKVIHSAASNAKNNFKQSIDELYITKLLVTKGPTYKRSLPISRGRTHPIRKRTSHITVEVGVLESAKPLAKDAVRGSDEPSGSRREEGPAKKESAPLGGDKKSTSKKATIKQTSVKKPKA